jgi:peptide/nickel transport system substrate-binding protein
MLCITLCNRAIENTFIAGIGCMSSFKTTISPSRRGLLRGGLAVGAVEAVLGQPRARAGETPVCGGQLIVGQFPEPAVLTSGLNTAGPTANISGKIFDGLLTYDFDFRAQPQLATAVEASPDGRTIRFTLRPGVTWHDGHPFTSADVAFSVLEIWLKYHARGRSTFANVASVETPDPLVVVVHLSQPAPFILNALVSTEAQVLPRHLYEGTDILANPHNIAPIGTGPFRFVRWDRGSHILLERNSGYWDQPKPYLDQILYRFIPDAGARSAALEAGDVHLVGESNVPGPDLARLAALPQLAFDTNGYDYGSSVALFEFNLDRPVLQDARVRRAVAHALDQQFIADAIWFGYGKPATGPIPPSFTAFYSDDVPRYPHDLKRAAALLDEAGLRPDAQGIRLSITHDFMPYGDPYQRTADYIRDALKKIGIRVAIRTQDYAAFVKRVYTDRDFDTTNYSASTGPDPAIGVQRFYWSKNFQPGVAFSNGSHYARPEVDAALEEAAVETDPQRRRALYAQFQALVQADLPELPLSVLRQVTIAQRRVRRHTVTIDGIRGNFAETYVLPA